jgi:hypothetical protein
VTGPLSAVRIEGDLDAGGAAGAARRLLGPGRRRRREGAGAGHLEVGGVAVALGPRAGQPVRRLRSVADAVTTGRRAARLEYLPPPVPGSQTLLHVSKDQQRKRFLARIDDPTKDWKFSAGDVAERQHWREYRAAYEDTIRRTATEDTPWYVVSERVCVWPPSSSRPWIR